MIIIIIIIYIWIKLNLTKLSLSLVKLREKPTKFLKKSLIALKDYFFKQATPIGGGGDILKYPSSIF